AVGKESGAEAGVVPRVHLFQPPDFEDVGAAVADGDGPSHVLNLSQTPAGISPVVDERTVRAHPELFSALCVGAALGVANVIFHQYFRRTWRAKVRPHSVRQGAGTTINELGLHVRPTQILPPVQRRPRWPYVGVAV